MNKGGKIMEKMLYRFKNEALEALNKSGKSGYLSSADDRDGLELEGFGPSFNWGGEVQAFRTDDGDIFAWWEDELDASALVNGVACVNGGEPYKIEDEEMAAGVLAAGDAEEITDRDAFMAARCDLDLNDERPQHLYRCGEALFCLSIDL